MYDNQSRFKVAPKKQTLRRKNSGSLLSFKDVSQQDSEKESEESQQDYSSSYSSIDDQVMINLGSDEDEDVRDLPFMSVE